ncbi:MAG: ThuA domain-containing protein [Capsulimonadaceae bacterium]
MTTQPVRVLVWDESPKHAPKAVYPHSINGAIAEGLLGSGGEILARTAGLDDPEQGLSEAALEEADVIVWWGHMRHGDVADDAAQRVIDRVHTGRLGLVALHSAHYSKVFKGALGCPGHLGGGWRDNEPYDTEEIRVCAPKHPIAEGIDDFVLREEEMYGAPFQVSAPEVIVFQSYFPLGGQYFPSFATTVGEGIDTSFTSGPGRGIGRGHGAGRVFYFRPGHEIFPTYYHPVVRRILRNAVLWTGKRS